MSTIPEWAPQALLSFAKLFDEYGVARWDWQALAVLMAARHEPTIQALNTGRRRRTKPTKWTPARKLQLWNAIDQRPRGINAKRALYNASNDPKFVAVSVHDRRLREARKDPLVQMLERARKHFGDEKFAALMDGVDIDSIVAHLDRFDASQT